MPNVLIFSTDYKPNRGGIAEHTYQVAKHLSKRGCEVAVLAKKTGNCGEFDNAQGFKTFRVISVPLLSRLILLISLIFICKRRGIEYVYSTITNPCGELAFLGSFFCRYKNIIVVHGYEVNYEGPGLRGWIKKKLRFVRTHILNRADTVIAVSENTRQNLVRSGVEDSRIKVIPNGVDPDDWKHRGGDEELIGRYRLKGKRVILTVGKLIRRKNHETVIKALSMIRSVLPDTRYLIAGEGPHEGNLRRLAADLRLEEHVIFLGGAHQGKLNRLYNTCDIFVMPNTQHGSSVEGFGIVFLEANACRKPVIAGRSGGVVDAVVDGETGFLVDPCDEKQLADRIIKLLGDADLARRLGQKGFDRVMAQFTWNSIVSRIMAVFEEA